MNSQQKTVNLLSICRKAGKLILGFDAVKEAAMEGDISCVIVTEDISLKTLKEVKFFCANTHTDIVKVDMTKEEMFDTVSKEVAVVGVADKGFAKKLAELGTPVRATIPRSAKQSMTGLNENAASGERVPKHDEHDPSKSAFLTAKIGKHEDKDK